MELRGFKSVDPWSLDINAFQKIGKEFMEIVIGERDEGANAMTASWGGIGVMWNMPVAFIVVRGNEYRYSRDILEARPNFSLCFLGKDFKKAKGYLGTVHGWDDPDKISSAGLETGWCCDAPTHHANIEEGKRVAVPFIEQSEIVLIGEKVLAQELPKEGFIDQSVWDAFYSAEGQHCLYVAEIKQAFLKEHDD